VGSSHDSRGAGRFAPSPTGSLHLGNLRTALLAWLFARSQDQRFRMRVENLDVGRVRPEFERDQLDDLRAIGLDWDGPVVRQSERAELYAETIAQLDRDGLLYPCFCTRAEIREAASAPHAPLPEGHYPGTCRTLTPGQRAQQEAAGRPPALRFRAEAAEITWHDRLLGPQSGTVDDFVIRRNDSAPAYNLAVVVDDGAQQITEVVRGADLLDTTPRQILLARALDIPRPAHAHVPLMLAPDGARLAKRHGAVTLRDRAALGESPARVLSHLAETLELADSGEPVTPTGLLERFDPVRLPREATRLEETTLAA